MMRHIFVYSIMAVIVTAVALTGCKREDMLSLDDDEFIFAYDDTEIRKTTVISNVRWTASTTADWITLSPAGAKITTMLSVSVSVNTEGSERSAEVIVTQVGGEGLSGTLTVIQEAD